MSSGQLTWVTLETCTYRLFSTHIISILLIPAQLLYYANTFAVPLFACMIMTLAISKVGS